jgi:hypothetical protein
MASKYWARVRKRAWKDTIQTVGLDTWQRVVTKTFIALGAIVIIAYFGGRLMHEGPVALHAVASGRQLR